MCEPQHDRRVRIRAGGQPFGADLIHHVGADRADIDELDARRRCGAEAVFLDMLADAPGLDLAVLHRNAAEGHEQLSILSDGSPGCRPVHELAIIAQHMGHDRLRRAEGIGAEGGREPAPHVQEPLQLALRVVEPPGGAPAIGPGVDRAVAMVAAHAGQLIRDEGFKLLPRDLDIALFSAQLGARARPVAQPAFPHHRRGDACGRMERRDDAGADGRRVRVFLERMQGLDAAILHLDAVGSPVGGGQRQMIVHRIGSGSGRFAQ